MTAHADNVASTWPASTKPLARVVQAIDDWLNPIVVKELRQAVRARYVLAVFLLFLIGQLVAMSVYITRLGRELPLEAGQPIFWTLFAILSVACTLLVPAYCGVRVALEYGTERSNLLLATPLPLRSVVAGKLLSGLTITLLIYSVSAPFLVFTYLLRGIDLPTILWVLAFGFACSALAIQVAIFIGSIRAHPVARGLLGLLALGGLLVLFGMPSAGPLSGLLLGVEEWFFRVFAIAVVLTAAGHLFVWTVGAMSPASSNWARPVRLFITITWLVTGVIAFFGGMVGVAFWGMLSTLSLCVALFVAVSEPLEPSRRVARRMPAGGMRWLWAFLFSTGVGGGITWAWMVALLNGLVVIFGVAREPYAVGGVLTVMCLLWFGAMASAMTAFLIRWSTRGRLSPAGTGVVGALIWIVTSPLAVPLTPGGYIALSLLWSVFAGSLNLHVVSEGTWLLDQAPSRDDMTPSRISFYWSPDGAARTSSCKPDPDGIPRSTVRLYKRPKKRFFTFGTRDE